MSINLRYPNITGVTEKEQIAQIRSYLHQLVEQLNYALPSLGSGGTSGQIAEAQGSDMSYYELRSMVIHELQQLDIKFEQLSTSIHAANAHALDGISFTMDEEGNLYYEVEE